MIFFVEVTISPTLVFSNPESHGLLFLIVFIKKIHRLEGSGGIHPTNISNPNREQALDTPEFADRRAG